MMYPPSLSEDVKARAFVAPNNELGLLLSDASSFLDACRVDNVTVLGWELWIVNHDWGTNGQPIPAPGVWCGLIPLRDGTSPGVFGGTDDADATARELHALDLGAEIPPAWLPHVRINFTISN